jgi:adenylate cyclase
MAIEIEKKFLLKDDTWQHDTAGMRCVQGYLPTQPDSFVTARIRIIGDHARITVKGPTEGAGRSEFEYPIPLDDATEMLATLCTGHLVEKTRYIVSVGMHRWEVDLFHGLNEGLVVAEIELSDPAEAFTMPAWAGQEVTGEARYYNAQLSRRPFSTWSAAERATA